MSEIDKLINQAFPDELRDIEPIDVDEDAILSMTLENLGLKPSPKIELPELTVRPPRRRRTGGQRKKEEEPEFVEVPVVVHHRWMDWAGWAIAACLVLVFAVNWGPWLINNLDFGLGPRSTGEVSFSDGGGSMVPGIIAEDGSYSIKMKAIKAKYGYDSATFTLSFEISGEEDIDLDKVEVQLESNEDGKKVSKISRNSFGQEMEIQLNYKLDMARDLTMTVSYLVPLSVDRGETAGYYYQEIEKLNINLRSGLARSQRSDREYSFEPYS